MKLKCNKEEMLAIQDMAYYSLKIETRLILTSKFKGNDYECNWHLGNAYSIALQLYLSGLEEGDGCVGWTEVNREIVKQINIYLISKKDQYYSFRHKEEINESFKIEMDNDEIVISMDDAYFFNLEYDVHIFNALINENLDDVCFHYRMKYKDVDPDKIKEIYSNIFLYDRVSDHIEKKMKIYKGVVDRIWST